MQHLWAQSQSSFIDLFPVKWNRHFSLFAALWSLFFCRSLFWVLFKPSVLSLEQQSCMVWRYCCICCHLMGEYSLGGLNSLHLCGRYKCFCSTRIVQEKQQQLHAMRAKGKGNLLSNFSTWAVWYSDRAVRNHYRAGERSPLGLIRLKWCFSHHRSDWQSVFYVVLR